MAESKIEWTDKVWNPVTGYTKVRRRYAAPKRTKVGGVKSMSGGTR
jgi:protein gp37